MVPHLIILSLFSVSFVLDKYPTITAADEIKSYYTSPDQRPAPVDRYLVIAQLLLDICTINSYAINASIKQLPSAPAPVPTLFEVRLRAPANLWSCQVLQYRKDSPNNYFELKLLEALSRRLYLQFNVKNTRIDNQIDVIHIISVT
jgi:hypothetical protein